MLRSAAFLLLTCWIASDSADAWAQPTEPSRCNLKVIAVTIRNGQTPNVAGCDLQSLFNNLREAGLTPRLDREANSSVDRGAVSRLAIEGDGAIIYVSAGAPPPTPPPPPEPPPPEGPTGAVAPPKPRFIISAPPSVQEGDRVTLTVRREGSDGQAHRLQFITDRTELLKAAIPPITLEPNVDELPFSVATAWGEPGDGVHELKIAIAADESGEGGEPVSVTITDAPPNSYAIESSANVRRGDAIEFTISRSGPLRPDRLEFDFVQDASVIRPQGVLHPLSFQEGDAALSLTLPAGSYLPCQTPPVLTLKLETPVSGSASFADPPPDYCNVLPPRKFPPPWWPIPVVIIVAVGTAYVLRKPWAPTPPPALYPTWDIEAGAPAFAAEVPKIPGWPRFSTRTTLEWGGASLPDPLPTAEKKDG